MKESTRTSSSFLNVSPLERNAGKVYWSSLIFVSNDTLNESDYHYFVSIKLDNRKLILKPKQVEEFVSSF